MKALIEFIKSIGEFLIITVCLKYVIGHKIAKWIERKLDEHPIKFGRLVAIWTHYQLQAGGNGHDSEHVLECHEESCQILKTTPARSVLRSTS